MAYRQNKLWDLLKTLAKGGGEAAKGLTDAFWEGATGYGTEELVNKVSEALAADKPTGSGVSSDFAGLQKNANVPDTFSSEPSSFSPEQPATKTPETFSNQRSPTNTGGMSEEDSKLVTAFTSQNGTVMTKEELLAFTDPEKTKMLFALTGKETKPWKVDLELTRLRFEAQTIYENSLRR